MQLSEAKQALCNKLNILYADVQAGINDLFSDADLTDAIQAGVNIAWDYERWQFTLDAKKTTVSSDDLTNGYLDYPNTFEDESIFLLTVNGGEWGKRNFADYQRYFSDNPTATDKLWSEFKRVYFVNVNSLALNDEIDVYGKLRAPTMVNATDKLPFSPENDNDENSGNRAIVELAYAEILESDKKKNPAGAEVARKKALGWLAALWAPMAARKSQEQSQNRGFFDDVPDFFAPKGSGRSTNIGNFP